MKNRCKIDARKIMKNRCQNGSQNPWKWLPKSTWSRPWAPISHFGRLLERCKNIAIFWCLSWGPKNRKKLPKDQPKGDLGPTSPHRVSVFLEYGPQGGAFSRARVPCTKVQRVQSTRYKGTKGSNTPKGQRPGEFWKSIIPEGCESSRRDLPNTRQMAIRARGWGN